MEIFVQGWIFEIWTKSLTFFKGFRERILPEYKGKKQLSYALEFSIFYNGFLFFLKPVLRWVTLNLCSKYILSNQVKQWKRTCNTYAT